MFKLHERLAADTFSVGKLALCEILLMNDKNYPWLILVPMAENIREFTDLSTENQTKLMAEITATSRALQDVTKAFKMNVAALGNMVPQLHIHVIARFEGDAAWPAPVWGKHPAEPYTEGEKNELLAKISEKLSILS